MGWRIAATHPLLYQRRRIRELCGANTLEQDQHVQIADAGYRLSTRYRSKQNNTPQLVTELRAKFPGQLPGNYTGIQHSLPLPCAKFDGQGMCPKTPRRANPPKLEKITEKV